MADNKQWFKVWTSILTDPGFENMDFESVGRWLILGAFTAQHGKEGILKVPKNTLAKRLICNVTDIENIIKKMPNINYANCNDCVTLQFLNWGKYQATSSSYERVKKFRMKHRVTLSCNGDKKREEKKRNEEKRCTVLTLENFISEIKNNPAYKDIDIDKELHKMDAWLLSPKGKGRKKTKGFILNWLNKIDTALPIQQVDWRG